MKFSSFFLVLVLVFAVLGFISFGSSATYEGSFNVSSGDGSININTGNCTENWAFVWSQCVDNSQTKICFDQNQCGTTNYIPATCGTTQECSLLYCGDGICNNGETSSSCSADCSTNNGGGGGSGGGGGGVLTTTSDNDTENSLNGGGSGSCIETWVCEDWSNVEGQCGTRECTDQNACGTEYFKPLTDLECVSTTGVSGFTGAVTGVTDKVFSTPGIYVPILFVVLVIAGGLIVLALGAGKKNKKGFAQP